MSFDRSQDAQDCLATLQAENQRLGEQVKKLVKTESALYSFQEKLDRQLRLYSRLHETSKQLNSTFDRDEITQIICQFALYDLNFERCVILMKSLNSQRFYPVTWDGYYEDALIGAIGMETVACTEPTIAPLQTGADSVVGRSHKAHTMLQAFGARFFLDDYVIVSLGTDMVIGSESPRSPQPCDQAPFGLLIAGNTEAKRDYHASLEGESLLGLANLASQAAIALKNAQFYHALQEEQAHLEAKVQVRTQELHQKNVFLEKTLNELQHTQLQLIQSEKMSSLGQLVAGVAHEINNPVNFISGNVTYAKTYLNDLLQVLDVYQYRYPMDADLQVLIDRVDLDFLRLDLPKVLNSMELGVDRIQEIVRSLKTFSRMDEAERKVVDIHAGIDSTLVILQSRLKACPEHPAITVIKDYGDLPPVECYPGQLNQVLMNILANAIDVLEEQARSSPPDSLAQIHIQTERPSTQHVRICITDNGPGIPEATQRRLFDPFFTTKPVGKGTGLGLSISYQIITETHKGSITCVSTPGQGTQFRIEIPIHPQ